MRNGCVCVYLWRATIPWHSLTFGHRNVGRTQFKRAISTRFAYWMLYSAQNWVPFRTYIVLSVAFAIRGQRLLSVRLHERCTHNIRVNVGRRPHDVQKLHVCVGVFQTVRRTTVTDDDYDDGSETIMIMRQTNEWKHRPSCSHQAHIKLIRREQVTRKRIADASSDDSKHWANVNSFLPPIRRHSFISISCNSGQQRSQCYAEISGKGERNQLRQNLQPDIRWVCVVGGRPWRFVGGLCE